MTYFKNIQTLEELRKEYKRLLKQYHPDNPNGSTEATQEINREYEELFERLSKADTGNKNANKYNKEVDAALREAINKIINLEGITIEIIGVWCWVGGSTYQHKKVLKEAGYRFSGNRKMWYFRTEEQKRKGASKRSLDELKLYYGCEEVKTEKSKKLTA